MINKASPADSCLTLRDNITEQPITPAEDMNRMVCRDRDRMAAAALKAIADPPPSSASALWDGEVGQCIAAALVAPGTASTVTDLPKRSVHHRLTIYAKAISEP